MGSLLKKVNLDNLSVMQNPKEIKNRKQNLERHNFSIDG